MSDETPLLDELEKGPWPSYVKEIKRAAKKNAAAKDLLGIQEQSYKDRVTHWKHGGIVGVTGYGAGVIGRYCDDPEKFPNVDRVPHHARQPAGGLVLHHEGAPEDLRHLGEVRKRHDQLSRLHRRHHPAGNDDGEPAALLRRAYRGGLRPGRLRLGAADAGGLRGPGAVRVCEYRHPGSDPRPHHDVPGRDAPSAVALQVQDQGLRLPQRLRGGHSEGRLHDHRHLARQPPDRPGRGQEVCERRVRHQVPRGEQVPDARPSSGTRKGATWSSTRRTASAACTAST